MNVLLVDDDPSSLFSTESKLRSIGYTVIIANDGEAAWRKFVEFKPAIIITDWLMPKINGIELTKMIRNQKETAYPYILFLTILGGKDNYLESIHAGGDDFITKPIDLDELHVRLVAAERILNLQKTVEELEDLLNVCSSCKKILDSDGKWKSVETIISSHVDVTFSHGICPDCYNSIVKPQMEEFKLRRSKGVS